MQYSRIHLYLLPILVILVYSFNTWASPANEAIFQSITVEGRQVFYNTSLTREHRRNLLQAIEKLEASGDDDLNGVDFKEMKKRSQEISIAVADGKPFVGSGYRDGAINFAEQGVIIFNLKKVRKYGHNQIIHNSWHETLEAMGYNDANYLASSILSQKASTSKITLHPHVSARLKKQLNQPRIRANKTWKDAEGGATGVGGGGDGDIGEIKGALIYVLQELAKIGELGPTHASTRILDFTIDTPIESIEFVEKYRVISQVAKFKVARSLITDELTVLVDPQDWPSLHLSSGAMTDTHIRFLTQLQLVIEAIGDVARPSAK